MIPSKVVMIRPLTFCSNPETQESNSFQKLSAPETSSEVVQKAQKEFDKFQEVLTSHGIEILKFEELPGANTPDALFPNNWFCQLPDGRAFIFPMYALNRQREIRDDVIDKLNGEICYLNHYAEKKLYLEGTGSIIFDHDHRLIYACISSRTSPDLLQEFAEKSGYKAIIFHSYDEEGNEIYHTNVMMALGKKNVIINLTSVTDVHEREFLIKTFQATGKNIVDISHEQTSNFAGNMLHLQNAKGDTFWVCSTRAYSVLTPSQREALESEGQILHSPLNTIENYGGGGARCLMAEVFSEK